MPDTILIVEAHDFLRWSLRGWLEAKLPGCQVIEATGEAEAIVLAEVNSPRVVILDIVQSQVSGLETVRQIKAAAPTAQVVILTGYTTEAYLADARTAGASACIPKCALSTDLPTTLALALSRLDEPVRCKQRKSWREFTRHILEKLALTMFTPKREARRGA